MEELNDEPLRVPQDTVHLHVFLLDRPIEK